MNKKQMVILWILGIWISTVIADIKVKFFFFYDYRSMKPLRVSLEILSPLIIPPLIIGGLLIYTLRTRKKQ